MQGLIEPMQEQDLDMQFAKTTQHVGAGADGTEDVA